MTERKGRKVIRVPKPKRIGTKSRTAFGAERSESERKERRLAKANKEADKKRRAAKRKAVSKKKTAKRKVVAKPKFAPAKPSDVNYKATGTSNVQDRSKFLDDHIIITRIKRS